MTDFTWNADDLNVADGFSRLQTIIYELQQVAKTLGFDLFGTVSEANSAGGTEGDSAIIVGDTAANNGYYARTGGTWVRKGPLGGIGLDVSTYMAGLLEDEDASAALATLGIGATGAALFAAASQSAARTAIGATATGSSLITAADAAAAKTTLALNNVNNTSDASKPVSTAQQTALDAKLNTSQTTAYSRTILDDADAAAARTTLGATTTGAALFTASTAATARATLATNDSIASAATLAVYANGASRYAVTGTTTITAFDTAPAPYEVNLRFSGVLTLTHSGSLVLPNGGANITTAANDTARFISLGGGSWYCAEYQRASGQALVGVTEATLLPTAVSAERTYRSYNAKEVLDSRREYTTRGHNYVLDFVQPGTDNPTGSEGILNGSASRNADGTYTIPVGSSVDFTLSGDTFNYTNAQTKYFMVSVTDPGMTGMSPSVRRASPSPNSTLVPASAFVEIAPGVMLASASDLAQGYDTTRVYFGVSNAGASTIRIFPPYAGTGVPWVDTHSTPSAATWQRPVRDMDYSIKSHATGARWLAERAVSVCVDSVAGSSGAAGTLYAPKQSLASVTPVTGGVAGLKRGSIWYENFPSIGGSVQGYTITDVSYGFEGQPLPIISAFAVVGGWTSNGDGTYSAAVSARDSRVDDATYDNVYVVEIDTTIEATNPVTSRRRMPQPGDTTGAGSSLITESPTDTFNVTIRPTSGAPGAKYRYEVIADYACIEWDTEQGGYLEGVVMHGASWGYGSIGGPTGLQMDRCAVLHGSTHHAVIGGGRVSRTVFWDKGDSDCIGLTFYNVSTAGLSFFIDDVYFYGCQGMDIIYAHNSGGPSYSSGSIERLVIYDPQPDGTDLGSKIGIGGYASVYQIEDLYIAGGVGEALSPRHNTRFSLNNSVVRGVGRVYTTHVTAPANITHCILQTQAFENSDVNRRGGTVLRYGSGSTSSVFENMTVEHNILHARSRGSGSQSSASVADFIPGVMRKNIIIADGGGSLNEIKSSGLWTYNASNLYFESDFNLIVCTRSLQNMQMSNGTLNTTWAGYLAESGQDANSLMLDVSAYPRGVREVFMDPDNGDYRFADTPLGRQAAEYCRLNDVGPWYTLAQWPRVPTPDEAYRQLALV